MARTRIHGNVYHLPVDRDDAAFLYAARFASGLVKIGATDCPRNRAIKLQRHRKDRIEEFRVEVVAPRRRVWSCERNALREASAIAKPICGHFEFFAELTFADAVEAIRKAALPEVAAPAAQAA